MKRFLLLANPRTASTYFSILLNYHPDIHIDDGSFGDKAPDPNENYLELIEKKLSVSDKKFIGIKLFPEEISERNLRFDDICRHNDINYVIVLWRKSVPAQLVSKNIAENTGRWYEGQESKTMINNNTIIVIEPDELNEYHTFLSDQWHRIGTEWPIDVKPIYLCFEDLMAKPIEEIQRVLTLMSVNVPLHDYSDLGQGKQLVPVWERISNWNELSPGLQSLEIDVKTLLSKEIEKNMDVDQSALQFVPDPEPPAPHNGWLYQVSKPFMPDQAKDNVMHAIQSGAVSSGANWAKELTEKLRLLFGSPVAQPCCNGFTALVLALQCVHIGKDDEVIVPSMTMVAVPNAVSFSGAVPVFADCAKDNYNPGLKEILEVATDKTKAVIITHSYGVPTADWEQTANECRQRNWFLIEDISECVGVTADTSAGSKLLGTLGDFACASMYANKIIHAGDGGFVLARDPRHTARLRSLVNHGFTPNYHFLHKESAINAKINGLGAALACGALDDIQTVLDHRKQLSQLYRKHLKYLPLELMPQCGPLDTPWVFGVRCQSKVIRTHLRAHMASNGVETRDFFFANHLQPPFKALNRKEGKPRAELLGSTGLYLPTYYGLNETDVQYICGLIKHFFTTGGIEKYNGLESKQIRNSSETALMVRSGSFTVEAIKYNKRNGAIEYEYNLGHPYIEAVRLDQQAKINLIKERWDSIQEWLTDLKECLLRAQAMNLKTDLLEKHFNAYKEYFDSIMPSKYEQGLNRSWLMENIDDPAYSACANVPTTTDKETLQLLVYLIKMFKPKQIIELGTWLGHSAILMAFAMSSYKAIDNSCRIYACDAYRWQQWMNEYVAEEDVFEINELFLPYIQKNWEIMKDIIVPVVMQYDSPLPSALAQVEADMVFIDFTQDSEELEEKWIELKANLIPNQTIIVFNGITMTSMPFLTRHSHELQTIAKPHTIAKAFRYVSAPKESSDITEENEIELKAKFKFELTPDWDHHCNNVYEVVINKLKHELHDSSAEILFIPAVEETLCDRRELLERNKWVGICHMTPDYPELFYVPDLRRLCTDRRYRKLMDNCKGLYALSKVQKEFLENNIRNTEYKIPIQHVTLPYFSQNGHGHESKVISLMSSGQSCDIILIGSFARDYHQFYSAKVPSPFRKSILIGSTMEQDIPEVPDNIYIQTRLNDKEYFDKLSSSIPFLSLKYDGAVNILLLECIHLNIPLVLPRMQTCVEYIGNDYPLLYDSTPELDLSSILTIDNIERAIDYLKNRDKSVFEMKAFIQSIKTGIVSILSSAEPTDPIPNFTAYDVTISICSFKRTHHLPQILDSLWNRQTYPGRIQVIVWNNNESRNSTVSDICAQYISQSTDRLSLELIQSTNNYYCAVRLALTPLMQSQCLLICDDDVMPGPEFVDFFMKSHNRYPNDVLCMRGHKFLPHILNENNPNEFWFNYEHLRFVHDTEPSQFIHFAHADICVIPRQALMECLSVPMPDQSYTLVDDYWMSFVLNHYFNRNIRKLSANEFSSKLYERTDDSDVNGLALYTRPETVRAKLKLYVHHMLQGWPHFEQVDKNSKIISKEMNITRDELLANKKLTWDKTFVGFNISCDITEKDIIDLAHTGVTCVRIGAVGLGDNANYEFNQLLLQPEQQLNRIKKTLKLLKANGIKAVLTLCRTVAKPDIWRFIAENLCSDDTVVGYDLINEPFTQLERELHWTEINEQNDQDGMNDLVDTYTQMIEAIRQVDTVTPLILESSFWGHVDALEKLPIMTLLAEDPNLLVSFHFYEPQVLTYREKNRKRYEFPSDVVIFDNSGYDETIRIDEKFIAEKLLRAQLWAQKYKVKLVLGEFGICREIPGAQDYLDCVMKCAKECAISSFVYSYRDLEWDAMDYELGTDVSTGIVKLETKDNHLFQTILNAVNN